MEKAFTINLTGARDAVADYIAFGRKYNLGIYVNPDTGDIFAARIGSVESQVILLFADPLTLEPGRAAIDKVYDTAAAMVYWDIIRDASDYSPFIIRVGRSGRVLIKDARAAL